MRQPRDDAKHDYYAAKVSENRPERDDGLAIDDDQPSLGHRERVKAMSLYPGTHSPQNVYRKPDESQAADYSNRIKKTDPSNVELFADNEATIKFRWRKCSRRNFIFRSFAGIILKSAANERQRVEV